MVTADTQQSQELQQQPGRAGGPVQTSVELWSVVVVGAPHLTQERGQVPTDCYREHQGHTDPEGAYENRQRAFKEQTLQSSSG